MSTSCVRTRVRRSVTAALSISLTAVGLGAVSVGAEAATGTLNYACSYTDGPGAFTLPVVIDTNAPSRMAVGQTAQITATSAGVLPEDEAKAAYDTGARRLDGPWLTRASFGAAAATIDQTIPRTDLPEQTVATPAPFTASSTPFAYTAPTTPGTVEITAGNMSGTWRFYDGAGVAVAERPVECTAPPGKAPVIDTIAVVATSTTTLTLDRTASEYGQDVTATAKVTTSSGTPDGDVAFSVDGLATKVRVGKDGVATLVLPDAPAGSHSVTATFVPRDATTYDGSTSAAQAWTVAKARTRMRIPVTGRTTTVVTRVGVKAKGVFDTVPTGKVRIKLKRIGKRGKWVKVRTLEAGAARAGFGRLKKGRYQVVVIYRGDANHRYLKKAKRFRVTRG